MIQTLIVSLVALAGAAVLVRKTLRAMRVKDGEGCPSCASGNACASKPAAAPTGPAQPAAVPLKFIR